MHPVHVTKVSTLDIIDAFKIFLRLFHTGVVLVQHGVEAKNQRGRICMLRILRLELPRHLATCLLTKNLLTRDPSVLVHQVRPRPEDHGSQFGVPSTNVEQMEAFVPVKAAREEAATWCGGQQTVRALWLGHGTMHIVQIHARIVQGPAIH